MPRKPKNPDSAPRPSLSLRTTVDLRHRLEKTALSAGKSISQEAEERLERSFYLGGLESMLKSSSAASIAVFNFMNKVERDAASRGRAVEQDDFLREYMRTGLIALANTFYGQPSEHVDDEAAADRGRLSGARGGRAIADAVLEGEALRRRTEET
jgi:hypothetical protein